MDWPDVGVVIVNWNNYEDTARCLESLEDIEYPQYRVIVVDNASPDGSGEQLAMEFDWCEFVFNDENLGFGGGCNAGIHHAMSRGVSHVLLLNNDAIVDAGFLREMVSVARESGADVVGALVESMAGGFVNPVPSRYPDMFFYSGYRSNLPFSSDAGNIDKRWWTSDRIEGAGVLLPRTVLEERMDSVGYYVDESLFLYGEEIELAVWCRARGKTCVVAGDAVVHHSGGASSDRWFQLYYLTRNRVLIAHRHFEGWHRLGFDILYPLSRFALAGRFLKRRNLRTAKAILAGLFDGYRGIEGAKAWST